MYIFMIFMTVALVLFALPKKKPARDPFEVYIRQIHQYSGLNPELFRSFVTTLDIFRETRDTKDLHQALEYLEELSMYSKDEKLVEEAFEIIKKIRLVGLAL